MSEEVIVAATLTTKEAAERHKGVTALKLSKLCLRGKFLTKFYGGASRIPEREKQTALFARKVGRDWQIPVSELDRLFLPPSLPD
ncbi:hypothetical protein [Geomonas subterranea]|uniref:hypothetical protein n=1 Tax=Geomonas subterranea TaxID=2847989 RepID=UPI001CD670FA|nr:hypothetical protein [Geomonas fuzhouensis]